MSRSGARPDVLLVRVGELLRGGTELTALASALDNSAMRFRDRVWAGNWTAVDESLSDMRAIYGELTVDTLEDVGPWTPHA